MTRVKLFQKLAYLVILLFIFNTIAVKLYWYYTIWWFDMPMHALGGLCTGLFVGWLIWPRPFSGKMVVSLCLGVLLLGVGWEIFEIIFKNMIGGEYFNALDTTSDVFFDLAGGTLAILYLARTNFRSRVQ